MPAEGGIRIVGICQSPDISPNKMPLYNHEMTVLGRFQEEIKPPHETGGQNNVVAAVAVRGEGSCFNDRRAWLLRTALSHPTRNTS